MKVTPVSSAHNPIAKRIRSLHDRAGREKSGLFLLEGAKLLNEAFARGVTILDVVVSQSFWTAGMPQVEQLNLSSISLVDDKLFKELITTQTPAGILAVGECVESSLEDCLRGDQTLIVIGEGIQDPGNAGTLMRAALAFGASGLVLTKGSVDCYNPKVVRSAMGALFQLPIVTGVETASLISQLKASGVERIFALEPDRGTRLATANLRGSIAIILGNEGQGMSEEGLSAADELLQIPMLEQTESLNVAVCGAVVLYQCAETRRMINS